VSTLSEQGRHFLAARRARRRDGKEDWCLYRGRALTEGERSSRYNGLDSRRPKDKDVHLGLSKRTEEEVLRSLRSDQEQRRRKLGSGEMAKTSEGKRERRGKKKEEKIKIL